MNQALLLIDIQNDYFPGGAMELVGSLEAGAQAGTVITGLPGESTPRHSYSAYFHSAGGYLFPAPYRGSRNP